MPFVCLFVPDFPVQASLRLDARLRGRAIAVWEGTPPMSKIISFNPAARKAGIELGMTKLCAESCGNVHLSQRSVHREGSAHAALLDCAQAYSPRVEDTTRIPRAQSTECRFHDTVVLDITGCDKLFGQPDMLAPRLRDRASELGLFVHVAVAGNPETAILAAKGFPGVTVIPPGHEAQRLAELPVALLDPGVELLTTLTRWGIHTLGQLAALPDVALVERLGQAGRRLQLLARGSHPRQLVPMETARNFEEFCELEYPVDLLDPLLFLLNPMLEQLCTRLSLHALATNELKLIFTLEQASSVLSNSGHERTGLHHRTLKVPVPICDSKVLLKLLQLDLQAHPPAAPVIAIKLTAEPSRPRVTQSGLFQPLTPEPERLEVTLARLRNLVGEGRVGSPVLMDTNRPHAFRVTQFLPPEASPQIRKEVHTFAQGLRTAFRVHRPPVGVQIELHQGMPRRLSSPKVRGQVIALAGPWRTTGDWWLEAAWAHEEWDVLLQSPTKGETHAVLYRIFRDLLSGQWYVEGSYD